MRYIKLTIEEKVTLEEGFRNHSKFHVRQRFQSLLLSNDGWKVNAITTLQHTRTRTIYTWMDRWSKMGIVGLFILPGRGVKSLLSVKDKFTLETIKKKSSILLET